MRRLTKPDYFRVEALVRYVGEHSPFRGPILRVIKRKKNGHGRFLSYRYFVGVPNAPVGHGKWCMGKDLTELSALEQLALECPED